MQGLRERQAVQDEHGHCASRHGGVEVCRARMQFIPLVHTLSTYYLRSRFQYAEIAPPHSYIDVRDFASVEALAKYLLYLDKNTEVMSHYVVTL